jgi:hypothetical protein
MDNGLIFPYPCTAVQAESLMLSAGADPSGEASARTEGVVGELAERRRRAAEPGRWLSRGKGVGRQTGKSVCQVPET